MTEIFNTRSQKHIRKMLRKVPIKAENQLWKNLRNNRTGYKFRRQFSIGKYIVDFYCPLLRLIVEADGATHSTDEEINNDRKRQAYLESLGLTVKRYDNSDIYNNLDDVLQNIISTCKELEQLKPKRGNENTR